jgi:tetratricopeptide (TPR) repeat protein
VEAWNDALNAGRASRHRNDILLGIAEAQFKQGHSEEAKKIYEDLSKGPIPEDVSQRVNLGYGDMLQTSGSYREAVVKYSLALSGPDMDLRVRAQYGAAESLYHARDYAGASEAYSKIAGSDKAFPGFVSKARFRQAKCFEKLGMREQAKALYRTILAQGGQDAERAAELLKELEKGKREE